MLPLPSLFNFLPPFDINEKGTSVMLPLSYCCVVEDRSIQLGDSMTTNFYLRYSKVSLGRCLIEMYETCSFVPIYSNLIFFSVTCSRRKWNFIEICLVLECITGFLEIVMALVLSHRIGIVSLHVMCMSYMVCFIQIIWVQQVFAAIYSSSMVDKDTKEFFLFDEDTS